MKKISHKILATLLLCVCLMMGTCKIWAKENNESKNNIEGTQNTEVQVQSQAVTTQADFSLTAQSAVLIEGSTGQILFSNQENMELPPASITKIMTLLLIFEAMEQKTITLEDMVTVSEYASSMGGSQVYLEPGETQTVNDLIKCISIASANDAAVTMAEYVAGSEAEFVKRMNEKAKALGMEHTNFQNCTGLDVENHYSSAYDIALMSRELITKYPQISNYSTVWMDTIIHKTKRGESEFGLTNTNKLVRFYQGITGLKTGSTDKAKFCLSATANRNGMDLIAVVMACPSPKDRFSEASKLLDYGFANCSIYKDEEVLRELVPVPVKKGEIEEVNGKIEEPFHYVCLNGKTPNDIVRKIEMEEFLTAPVEIGTRLGRVVYYYGEEEIGAVDILAKEEVKKANYFFYLKEIFEDFLCIDKKSRMSI